MKSSVLLFFVFATFLLDSCKKTERTEYPFPDDLKPYCMFKKGSYWIYRNDLTGAEDSSYLYSTATIYPAPYSETGPIAHSLGSYFGGNFLYSLNVSYDWRASEYRLSHYYFTDGSESFRSDGSESIVSGHLEKGYSEINENGNIEYLVIGIDDTLVIDNTVYKNILTTQFSRFHWQSADTIKFTYFFDKIHGLIRFVKTTNDIDTIWSLKRSLILR
jgi:hypothetical protein